MKFTTRLNKVLLASIITILSISACQQGSPAKIDQDLLTGFRLSLLQRIEEGDTIPHHWKVLQAVLPEKLDGFAPQNVQGGTFSPGAARFSSVSRFYKDVQGKFVFIKLSDYAADSSAFNFWIHKHAKVGQNWKTDKEVLWMDHSKKGQQHKMEGIRGSRYQLKMSTNRPEGSGIFQDVLEEMNWKVIDQ
ncbi:MAG: hypothetical protein AAFY71_05545 [Bacteroidota bacterium]